MKPPVRVIVVAQALVVGGLVAYGVWRALPADDPFSRLMRLVRAEGAASAARALGPDITKVAEGCPPDQLAQVLARAVQRDCRTTAADAQRIQVRCGERTLTLERWADGFRATPTCPPFLAGL